MPDVKIQLMHASAGVGPYANCLFTNSNKNATQAAFDTALECPAWL